MRTRRGGSYYSCHAAAAAAVAEGPEMHRRKRRRTAAEGSPAAVGGPPAGCVGLGDMLEELPDDLVVSILADVAASAGSPADLAGAILTCKRFRELAQSRVVLARASRRCLAVRAKGWSDAAHRFLQRCADAGNLDACYLLGMIRFYCLGSRGSGAALMAAAAVGDHREALYSLAVIQFNGSGGTKDDRDLRAGAALCARAASLGHVDALRELGHCLQDGYGVRRDPAEGRRLLVSANARELSLALAAAASHRLFPALPLGGGGSCPLLSDFGWSLPEVEPHPANLFMVDWWASRGSQAATKKAGAEAATGESDVGEIRLCSHVRCGRRETRRHEFRRCSVCGAANYCSRACQALDWKRAHKAQCVPMDRWLLAGGDAH